jgi:hypothetical protein
LLAVCAAVTTATARAEPAGTPIDHPLFDANHCLTDIQPSREESAVEFHWGCAEKKLITISCVFDRTGYLGLGPRFARPGWHCNHPLPVLEDENGHRISDVAIGDPHGRSVWAACAVADLLGCLRRCGPGRLRGAREALSRNRLLSRHDQDQQGRQPRRSQP